MLGLVGFPRKTIPGFGKTSETVYQLLEKERIFFGKKERSCIARNEAETSISAHPGLPEQPRCVHLNHQPSLTRMGAILTEKQNGVDRVIAYAGKTLTQSQRHSSATRREICAVVHFTNDFKSHLLGRIFVIVSNHRAMVWLYSSNDLEGMIARWFEKLGLISFEKGHNAGKDIDNW